MPITKLLEDIFRRPQELAKTLAYCLGVGHPALEAAAEILRESCHVNIAGIGSILAAGRGVLWFFSAHEHPAILWVTSELLHFDSLPPIL
jgi:hypothetical protein